MLKKSIAMLVLAVFIVISISSISSAAFTPVTDSELSKALQAFVKSSSNTENYSLSMPGGNIIIIDNGLNYSVEKSLTGSPTFTLEIPIRDGMTYEEYQKQLEKTLLSKLCYYAVANIQGIEFIDSTAYLKETLLDKAFANVASDEYVIEDDDTTSTSTSTSYVPGAPNPFAESGNVTSTATTIKKSEFGDYVIDYAKSLYTTAVTVNDSSKFNTFSWSLQLQGSDTSSYKLVSTLTINTAGKFSDLQGYGTPITIDDPVLGDDNTIDNNTTTNQVSNTTNNDASSGLTQYPNAGLEGEYLVFGLVNIAIICLVAFIFIELSKKPSSKNK